MTQRIHSYDLLPVAPLRERPDRGGRLGVGKVRLVCDIEIATCYSESVVDGVRATVGTDSFVTLAH